jgi:hypothetical protein
MNYEFVMPSVMLTEGPAPKGTPLVMEHTLTEGSLPAIEDLTSGYSTISSTEMLRPETVYVPTSDTTTSTQPIVTLLASQGKSIDNFLGNGQTIYSTGPIIATPYDSSSHMSSETISEALNPSHSSGIGKLGQFQYK